MRRPPPIRARHHRDRDHDDSAFGSITDSWAQQAPATRLEGYGRPVRGTLVALAVCTALAGCSPGGAEAPPARPRDVPLNGVDPCSLLTAPQRAQLGLDGRPVFASAPSALYNGAEVPMCSISGFEPRAVSVALSVVTSAGIERFSSDDLAADVRPAQVRDFPAVVAVPQRLDDNCTVSVDTAPGQQLAVQFADGGRLPPIPQDQLCRDAENVATAAMTTLLTRN
jgi:hypothetical protein